jgi:hypothetical protein
VISRIRGGLSRRSRKCAKRSKKYFTRAINATQVKGPPENGYLLFLEADLRVVFLEADFLVVFFEAVFFLAAFTIFRFLVFGTGSL